MSQSPEPPQSSQAQMTQAQMTYEAVVGILVEDAQPLAMLEHALAALPTPEPLCPFCVVLAALPFPDYATTRLCAEHLPVARALQCRGWNADTWHQRLAALARWRTLPPAGVTWWPQTACERAELIASLFTGEPVTAPDAMTNVQG